MSKKTGYVVATHPGDHSVDILLSDGRRLTGVQILSHNASTRTGTAGLPAVPDKADKWDVTKLTGQDMKAVVDFVDGVPLVMGFLFPQINQMTSDDPKLQVSRHQSDVYESIDGDGNWQQVHPSGAYVRIGETPDLVDMAGKNTDGTAAFDRNTDKKVFIRIQTAGGTAMVTCSPDGKVDVVAQQDVTVTTQGAATVEAIGIVKLKSSQLVIIDAPDAQTTGNLEVLGHLSFGGGISGVAGNASATAAIVGNLNITGGGIDVQDGHVVDNDIVLHDHIHQNNGGGPPVG